MKPTNSLLKEYGLTDYTYKILSIIRAGGSLTWPDLRQLFNAPHRVRALIERGLLDGPGRDERLYARPLSLTAEGYATLDKIQRGLHCPAWLNERRAKVLQRMGERGFLIRTPHAKDGITGGALRQLSRAGYIQARGALQWELTPLGREALRDWEAENPKSPGLPRAGKI